MKNPLSRFLVRWFVCSLGLWIAAGLLGGGINYQSKVHVIIVSGLVLALVNTILKPIIVIMSLPAILLTLGLFMIFVNGLTVLLASWLYKPLEVTNLWAAMLAGIVIGLVNYLVSAVLENRREA